MIHELSLKIKLSEEQQKNILDWIESQEFSRRVLKQLPNGQFIDITDDPEYADIVKEFLKKNNITKL